MTGSVPRANERICEESPPVGLVDVRCDRIDPSPDQNREAFDLDALRELADSIAGLGLLQPVRVRPMGDRWVLVAGERRLRAVRDLLSWSTIPAVVDESDDGLARALATLAENMVRLDPDAMEEARGLGRAATLYGLDASDLARRLGKSARWVRGRLALLELAPDVSHFVATGGLPIGRAELIAPLDTNRQRLALAAHQHGIGPDAFRALTGRLADEQAAESMFDPDDFLRVDEYVIEATAETTRDAAAPIREAAFGIAEIAEHFGVKPATVHKWRERGRFPVSEFTVGGSPAWWSTTVLAWAATTGRA